MLILTNDNHGYKVYCGFCAILCKLQVGMYLYPPWVRFWWVQVWCWKTQPMGYPCKTLPMTHLCLQPTSSNPKAVLSVLFRGHLSAPPCSPDPCPYNIIYSTYSIPIYTLHHLISNLQHTQMPV